MTLTNLNIIEFVNFLLKKVYNPIPIDIEIINNSFSKTKKDILYHFPNLTEEEIIEKEKFIFF